MDRWRARGRILRAGLASLFGMRTPPEPEVIAQMSPATGPAGAGPDPEQGHLVRMPSSRVPDEGGDSPSVPPAAAEGVQVYVDLRRQSDRGRDDSGGDN